MTAAANAATWAAIALSILAQGYIIGRQHRRRIERPQPAAPDTRRFTPAAEAYLADAMDRVTTIPNRAAAFDLADGRSLVLMDIAEFNRLTIRARTTQEILDHWDGDS